MKEKDDVKCLQIMGSAAPLKRASKSAGARMSKGKINKMTSEMCTIIMVSATTADKSRAQTQKQPKKGFTKFTDKDVFYSLMN